MPSKCLNVEYSGNCGAIMQETEINGISNNLLSEVEQNEKMVKWARISFLGIIEI